MSSFISLVFILALPFFPVNVFTFSKASTSNVFLQKTKTKSKPVVE